MTTQEQELIEEVREEVQRAYEMYGPFRTAHHGYSVILAELDEAKDEIRKGDLGRACEEMVQVAAMAVQFLKEFGD